MPNSCNFSFRLTVPLVRKNHKHLNTGQGSSASTLKALHSFAPCGGMPADSRAEITDLFLSKTKNPVSLGM